MNRITRLIPASAMLIASSIVTAPASATPGSGFAPSPIVNGTFGTLSVNTSSDKTDKWGMILKTLSSTDIGADRLTVQSGGYSGWHAHPAPVFVTVTQGSIIWYNGSDPLCTGTPHSAGGFLHRGCIRHAQHHERERRRVRCGCDQAGRVSRPGVPAEPRQTQQLQFLRAHRRGKPAGGAWGLLPPAIS